MSRLPGAGFVRMLFRGVVDRRARSFEVVAEVLRTESGRLARAIGLASAAEVERLRSRLAEVEREVVAARRTVTVDDASRPRRPSPRATGRSPRAERPEASIDPRPRGDRGGDA